MSNSDQIEMTHTDCEGQGNIIFWTANGCRYELAEVNFFEVSKKGIRVCLKKPNGVVALFKQQAREAFADRGQKIVTFLRSSPRVTAHEAIEKDAVIYVVDENMANDRRVSHFMPCRKHIRFKDGQQTPKVSGLPCLVRTYGQGMAMLARLIRTSKKVPKPIRSLLGNGINPRKFTRFPRGCLM